MFEASIQILSGLNFVNKRMCIT